MGVFPVNSGGNNKIENKNSYSVKSGDTLAKIAERFGVTVKDLVEANKGLIKNENYIQAGWKLNIPAKTLQRTSGSQINNVLCSDDKGDRVTITSQSLQSPLKKELKDKGKADTPNSDKLDPKKIGLLAVVIGGIKGMGSMKIGKVKIGNVTVQPYRSGPNWSMTFDTADCKELIRTMRQRGFNVTTNSRLIESCGKTTNIELTLSQSKTIGLIDAITAKLYGASKTGEMVKVQYGGKGQQVAVGRLSQFKEVIKNPSKIWKEYLRPSNTKGTITYGNGSEAKTLSLRDVEGGAARSTAKTGGMAGTFFSFALNILPIAIGVVADQQEFSTAQDMVLKGSFDDVRKLVDKDPDRALTYARDLQRHGAGLEKNDWTNAHPGSAKKFFNFLDSIIIEENRGSWPIKKGNYIFTQEINKADLTKEELTNLVYALFKYARNNREALHEPRRMA
ncbi:MAG: LysM peptidoglycan-binding domain-containing protein [bacterium]